MMSTDVERLFNFAQISRFPFQTKRKSGRRFSIPAVIVSNDRIEKIVIRNENTLYILCDVLDQKWCGWGSNTVRMELNRLVVRIIKFSLNRPAQRCSDVPSGFVGFLSEAHLFSGNSTSNLVYTRKHTVIEKCFEANDNHRDKKNEIWYLKRF